MKQLAALLLLFSQTSMAQLPTEQKSTPFDKFIQKPEIEWAAYINDTIRFEDPNLNRLLLDRLSRNQIKATLPVGYGTDETARIRFKTLKEIDRVKLGETMMPEYDSAGNLVRTLKIANQIDTSSFNLIQLIQVLFLENGRLFTYVPWVSTMMPVHTSTGLFIGYGNYFSGCFNYNHHYQPAPGNKITRLKKTSRLLKADSVDSRNKLKELYGRTLVMSIWPHILNGKIAVTEYATGKRILPKDINSNLVNLEKIVVPVYDLYGNVTGQQNVTDPLYPSDFSSVELVQEWYYDHSKNIVYNTVKDVVLYARKRRPGGQELQDSPILKLVFK